MKKKHSKVLVAMSGGVDSSVAAYLLKKEGFDVVGVSMHLVSCHRPTTQSCCSAQDRLDARMVCETLGIPYATLDYRKEFQERVIQPFVAAYAEGRTPIPCTTCNAELKFSAFFGEMERQSASFVATGHYARATKENDGLYHLYRGADQGKDQSYYLFQLTQRELSRLLFPLGELTKKDVRKIAKEQWLVTQDKPESQEICFVADDDYVSFVEQHGSQMLKGPGDFIDREGKVLGRHVGIHAYTIGQRRGLGKGFGRRMYVAAIRPESNQVVLGHEDELMKQEMIVDRVGFVSEPNPERVSDVDVRIRSMHTPAPARIEQMEGEKYVVHFEKPQRAIAPGQAAVFYRGEEVLGGGWIQ